MTEKFELVDKIKLVDAFEPNKILAVILDNKFGKKLLKVLRSLASAEQPEETASEDVPDKKAAKLEELRSKYKELKYKHLLLELKFNRYKAILEANDLMPHAGRRLVGKDGKPIARARDKTPSEPKQKMCPGYKTDAHPFIPKSPNQKYCPSCKLKIQIDRENGSYKKEDTVATRIECRGGTQSSHIPTIEEVLEMTDIAEKQKWMARWSPAERKQAAIVKSRMDYARMRKLRNKGFSVDDPIMGANAKPI